MRASASLVLSMGRSDPMSNSHDELPEQETLRRRLRAAMLIRDVTLQQLASRIDESEKLSARTLRKLTNAESEIRLRALRPIADALEVPLDWFLSDSIFDPFKPRPVTPEFERRLRELEEAQAELRSLLDHEPPSAAAPSTSRRQPARATRARNPRTSER